jgi:cobalamin biosynthetic protein CobC
VVVTPVPSPEYTGTPHHGGRLRAAAARYGIPLTQWLDLSTGINPHPWPVPALAAHAWTRLPEPDDDLVDAARAYYGAAHVLPVAGSQAAIQALPALRHAQRVGVLAPAYAEHARAWHRHGHRVTPLDVHAIDQQVNNVDVLVLLNPNNPTGARFARDDLLGWHQRLAMRGGWLVVDEAFADTRPEHSLAAYTGRTGLVVLRSLGKFFGLAGARVGFVLAAPDLLRALDQHLGPWTVAGPARAVACAALTDHAWQATTRIRLAHAATRLARLLERHGLAPAGGTELFQWLRTPAAAPLHAYLAHRGILTRLFDDPPSLRLGLPGDDCEWQRLDTTLATAARAPA